VGGYGLISSNRRAWLRHEVWHEVVAPILAAMLDAPSTHAGLMKSLERP
jgi:hypothetical protein